MTEAVRTAVIYYSATGNVYAMAQAAAEAARAAGSDVRLLKVKELAPEEAIQSNEGWAANALATQNVPEASLDDLEWADMVMIGTPTRYGLPAAQMKQFMDLTGPLWGQGKLADKVYTAFTSAGTRHGGQESTILAISNVFYHWGGILVPPGYTDAIQFEAGNPYGVSHVSNNATVPPGEVELNAVRFQARRAVEVADLIKRGREQVSSTAPQDAAEIAGMVGVGA